MSPTLTPVFVVSFLLYYHLISKPASRIWFPLPLVFSYQSILHATIEINILKHFHHVTFQLKSLQWFSTVQEIKIQTLQSRLRPSEPDLPSHFIISFQMNLKGPISFSSNTPCGFLPLNVLLHTSFFVVPAFPPSVTYLSKLIVPFHDMISQNTPAFTKSLLMQHHMIFKLLVWVRINLYLNFINLFTYNVQHNPKQTVEHFLN